MNDNDDIINFFLGTTSFPLGQGSIILISKWYFENGDFVKKGDEILEVQSQYTKRLFVTIAEADGILEIINKEEKYIEASKSLIFSIHTDYDARLI